MYKHDFINKTIQDKGLTFTEVAKLADLNINTVLKVRKGKEIQVETLEKIARALQIPICELFESTETVTA